MLEWDHFRWHLCAGDLGMAPGIILRSHFCPLGKQEKGEVPRSFLACVRMGTWSTVLHAQRILGDWRPSVLDDSLQLEEAGQKEAPR